MHFRKLIHKLFALPGRGMQTFEAFQRFDRKLGAPHRSFRSIHIGGTNGKGSVATKIGVALQQKGFRVGLYTSPHISSVRERIQINGELIPEEMMAKYLSYLFDLADEELSFFDFLTALAFLYFRNERVDWAVVEVGLGGRLDATNVIDPVLSIITSIARDHTELLGETLEKIAREKGGIIKLGVPLIAGPRAAPFFLGAETVPETSAFYDAENSTIARIALERLGISQDAIAKGIQARPKCRFEMIGNTILDVAHNPDGFQRLVEALQMHFPNEKFHFIVAFSKEKEWRICLDLIQPYAEKISFVEHPRLRSFGGSRIEDLLGTSSAREVVCGSFYIMAEARCWLGFDDARDPEK